MEMEQFTELMGDSSLRLCPDLCMQPYYKKEGYERVEGADGASEVHIKLSLHKNVPEVSRKDEYAGVCLKVFEALESGNAVGVLTACNEVYSQQYTTFNINHIVWLKGLLSLLQTLLAEDVEDVETVADVYNMKKVMSLDSTAVCRDSLSAMMRVTGVLFATEALQKFLTESVGRMIYNYKVNNKVSKVMLLEYAKHYEKVFGADEVDRLIGSGDWRNPSKDKALEKTGVYADDTFVLCISLGFFVVGVLLVIFAQGIITDSFIAALIMGAASVLSGAVVLGAYVANRLLYKYWRMKCFKLVQVFVDSNPWQINW